MTSVPSGRSLGNVSAMQSTCWVIWGTQGSVHCRVVLASPARRMTGHAMRRTAGKQGSWCTPTWMSSDHPLGSHSDFVLVYSCCKALDPGTTVVPCRYGVQMHVLLCAVRGPFGMLAVAKHPHVTIHPVEEVVRNCEACRYTWAATQQLYSVLWQPYVAFDHPSMNFDS